MHRLKHDWISLLTWIGSKSNFLNRKRLYQPAAIQKTTSTWNWPLRQKPLLLSLEIKASSPCILFGVFLF